MIEYNFFYKSKEAHKILSSFSLSSLADKNNYKYIIEKNTKTYKC